MSEERWTGLNIRPSDVRAHHILARDTTGVPPYSFSLSKPRRSAHPFEILSSLLQEDMVWPFYPHIDRPTAP